MRNGLATLLNLLLWVTSATLSFAASAAILMFSPQLVSLLPLGETYFPDTVIQDLTYGELFGFLLFASLGASMIGTLHGYLFRKRYANTATFAMMVPALLAVVMLMAATLGAAIVTLPLAIAYGAVFRFALRVTARSRTRGSEAVHAFARGLLAESRISSPGDDGGSKRSPAPLKP